MGKVPTQLVFNTIQKGNGDGDLLHSVLINGIPRYIRDLHPRHRSVTLEDDGSYSSSESDLSTPLLYGTEPGDSSTELKEAEADNDDAENERGPLNSYGRISFNFM